jgi:hypothetical protein
MDDQTHNSDDKALSVCIKSSSMDPVTPSIFTSKGHLGMTEISYDERLTPALGDRGKTGRRVVDRLRARGFPVRVGSRTGQPCFNWDNPDTWAPVLQSDGVQRSLGGLPRGFTYCAARTADTGLWAQAADR